MMRTKETICQMRFSTAAFLMLSVLLSGCLLRSGQDSSANAREWVQSGLLSLSRPAPAARNSQQPNVLGFMPSTQQKQHASLVVDIKERTLVVSRDSETVDEMVAEALAELTPGRYTVLHKQRNPLWHATEEYFQSRGLPVPPVGSKARYFRGALGDFVLFLDKETPIHNAPVYCEEVGGIQVASDAMSRLFYQLEVGSQVEVRP